MNACIKLFSGKLRVHIAFLPMFVILCVLAGAERTSAFICALLLHEGAHFIMAGAVGVEIYYIELLPFGCMAKTGGFRLVNRYKSVLVAASGPAANMMGASIVSGADGAWMGMFFESNLMLAAMNLLPALPLDGGRILADSLALYMGSARADKTVYILGIAAGAVLCAAGIAASAFGVLPMGVMLIYSAIKGMNDGVGSAICDSGKKQSEFRKRRISDINGMAVSEDCCSAELMGRLDPRRVNIVCVLDKNMKPIGCVSETEIIDCVLKHGTHTRVGMLIDGKRKF